MNNKVARNKSYRALAKLQSEVAQWYLTLCDLIDYSLAGSSIHGILQARILEWIAIAFSRGSSRWKDQTQVTGIEGRLFTVWTTLDNCKSKTTPRFSQVTPPTEDEFQI